MTAQAVGHRLVVLLDARQHLRVERLLEGRGGFHHRVGIGVFRGQVGDDLGVVLLPHPVVVVLAHVAVDHVGPGNLPGDRGAGVQGGLRHAPHRTTGGPLARPCARSLHWRDPAMPELPDVTVYIEALATRIGGARLERIRLANPFVLRSVEPPPAEVVGRTVTGVRRLGKRIVIALEGELFVLIHLMIAGRLHWKDAGAKLPGKIGLAALDFSTGTVTLTEAGSKRRAAIHLVRGEAALAASRPRRSRALDGRRGGLPRRDHPRVPHAQADADRSAHPERHRQCLLRRDPAPGPALAGAHDAPAHGSGERAPVRGREGHADRLDRAPAPGGRAARSRRV